MGTTSVTRWLLAAASCLVAAGCGGQPDAAAPREPTASQSSGPGDSTAAAPSTAKAGTSTGSPATSIREVSAAGLPIGDYLPPLDGGRIELPIPTGWSPLPRDSNFVVRFYKNDRNGLPRIEVLVDDRSLTGMERVTAKNVTTFAKAVGESLNAEGKKPAEPVVPMRIGEVYCARYVLNVELKMGGTSVVAERQSIVTSRDGRTYTIHLLVLPNRLLPDRDASYAVCAGMRQPQ